MGEIKAGVPQGSVLGLLVYILYTNNIPDLEADIIGFLVDDQANLLNEKNYEDAARKLHISVNKIYSGKKKENKS